MQLISARGWRREMALAKKRIAELYQKRAGFYDFSGFYFGAVYISAGEKR